jgi:hypothetical protein
MTSADMVTIRPRPRNPPGAPARIFPSLRRPSSGLIERHLVVAGMIARIDF